MQIPDTVKANIVWAIKVGSPVIFEEDEIDRLLEIGDEYITFWKLLAFSRIQMYKEGGEIKSVCLTQKQFNIIKGIILDIRTDIETYQNPLVQKAIEAFVNGMHCGRIAFTADGK